MPLRLVLADSHFPFRKELKRLIELNPGQSVVGEADDFVGLVECIKSLGPDLILIDLFMPRFRGINAIAEIKKIRPDARILVLSMYQERAYLCRSMSAGADGYLLKENVFEELPAAIESIQEGRKCVSSSLDRRAPEIQDGTMRQPDRRMVPWNHLKMVSLGNCLEDSGV